MYFRQTNFQLQMSRKQAFFEYLLYQIDTKGMQNNEEKSQKTEQGKPKEKSQGQKTREPEKAVESTRHLTDKEYIQITLLLAEKFVTQDYSFTLSNKALKKRGYKPISSPTYNNIMTSITFLIEACHQNLRPLTEKQFNVVRSPMLHCRKCLSQEEINTIFKFTIRCFNLQNKKVYITQEQASHLYGQLLQCSKKDHEISYIMLHRLRKNYKPINVRENLKSSYVSSDVVYTNKG